MAARTSVYRVFVRLYPQQFRDHYGDDLVQHFEDLVRRDGVRRAWQRTAVDLVVTVPRFRLETTMAPRHSTVGVWLLVAGLAFAGIVGYFMGFALAVLLVIAALVVAVAERGRLASSLRPSTPSRRRRLLLTSGLLVVATVATPFIGFAHLGDEHWSGRLLLFYNATFFMLLSAALFCGVMGLRTPRSSQRSALRAP
jgi:hypothetical protein